MKKILITAIMCCLGIPMLAQQNIPFVSFKPVHAQPVQVTPPTLPTYSDPMDPLGLGRRPTSNATNTPKFTEQKEHFDLTLGSRYNTEEIGRKFKFYYEDYAYCGGTGDFYQISVYYKCSKEGATFGGCTIDFYKGRFWKISYRDIKNAPQEFANKLENKLRNYSVSDTRYEYQCGDIYVEFDGKDLRYVSESVTKAIAGY